MVESRRKTDLDGAAIVAAVIINAHSTKGTVTPLDVHPFRESETPGTRITRGNITAIAQAIVSQNPKSHG